MATYAELKIQRSARQVGGPCRISAAVPFRCRDTFTRTDRNVCDAWCGCQQSPHKFRECILRVARICPLTQLGTVYQFRPDRATLLLDGRHRIPTLLPETLYIPGVEAVKSRPGNPGCREDPLAGPVADRVFVHTEAPRRLSYGQQLWPIRFYSHVCMIVSLLTLCSQRHGTTGPPRRRVSPRHLQASAPEGGVVLRGLDRVVVPVHDRDHHEFVALNDLIFTLSAQLVIPRW